MKTATDSPDRPAKTETEIEITPEMIEAGGSELRQRCFGEGHRDLVTFIYLAMESERHLASASASVIIEPR